MGLVVTRGAEEVFGNPVFQGLGISVGDLPNMISLLLAQILPAFELRSALWAHDSLLSSRGPAQGWIPMSLCYQKASPETMKGFRVWS